MNAAVTKAAVRPRVYGLARLSSQEQAREGKAGLQRQRDAIAQIAERNGLDVVTTIEAVDIRGKEIGNHPAVAALIAELERGSIDGVVVAEFSRLVRPEDLDFGLAVTIKKAHKVVWDTSGLIDANTSGGYWQSIFKGAQAGAEVSLMRERVTSAKEALRRAGGRPSSTACLPKMGLRYCRVPRGRGYWEYVQPEGELIKRVRFADRGCKLPGNF